MTRGQRISSQNNSALHLITESLGSSSRHHPLSGQWPILRLHPESKPHPIELSEVTGCLRGHNQVIGRQRVREGGAGNVEDLSTGSLKQIQRLIKTSQHLWLVSVLAEFVNDPDLYTSQVTGRTLPRCLPKGGYGIGQRR